VELFSVTNLAENELRYFDVGRMKTAEIIPLISAGVAAYVLHDCRLGQCCLGRSLGAVFDSTGVELGQQAVAPEISERELVPVRRCPIFLWPLILTGAKLTG
jgi:hypothetical protein